MPDSGVHLTTITITTSLDGRGEEIVSLEYDEDVSLVQLLGIFELCKDSVLNAAGED